MIVLPSATRRKLIEQLASAVSVIKPANTMPSLSGVLIKAAGAQISLTCSCIAQEVGATIHDGLEISGGHTLHAVVDARRLLEFLRAMPEGATTLSWTGKTLSLACGRSGVRLQFIGEPSDFPLTDSAFEQETRVSASTLREGLSAGLHAIAINDVRYYLKGANVSIAGNLLRVDATDGHRCVLVGPGLPADASFAALIPREAVLQLLAALPAPAGKSDKEQRQDISVLVRLGARRAQLSWREDGIERVLSTELLEGRFPDVSRVVPRSHGFSLVCDRQELQDAVARAQLAASAMSLKKSRAQVASITLTFGPDVLSIDAGDDGPAASIDTIGVTYEQAPDSAAPPCAGVNARYLLEALASLPSAYVKLAQGESASAAFVLCPHPQIEAMPRTLVVMPMRV